MVSASHAAPAQSGDSLCKRMIGPIVLTSIILSMTLVHLYHATSGLTDLVLLLILFSFLFFLSMAFANMFVLIATRPGPVPSRYKAERLEHYVLDELRRVIAAAQPVEGVVVPPAATASPCGMISAAASQKNQTSHNHNNNSVEDEDERMPANRVSFAALAQRNSAAAEEADLEHAVMTARLGLRDNDNNNNNNNQNDLHNFDNFQADPEEESRAEGGDVAVRMAPEGAASSASPTNMYEQVHHGAGDHDNNNSNQDENQDEDKGLPLYLPEEMLRRRYRKQIRGLPLVKVSDAARQALQQISDPAPSGASPGGPSSSSSSGRARNPALGEDIINTQEDADDRVTAMRRLLPDTTYCYVCQLYQACETIHCTNCGECVYRLKLHCVFFGTCVGFRNLKNYILFLFYLLLAAFLADCLDIYVVQTGYSYFFDVPGKDPNTFYFLIFMYTFTFSFVTLGCFFQTVRTTGKGEGLVTAFKRAVQRDLQNPRESELSRRHGHANSNYGLLVGQSDLAPDLPQEQKFEWARVWKVLGDGLLPFYWFLPVNAVSVNDETRETEAFWTQIKENIALRLRSVADVDDVYAWEAPPAEGGGLALLSEMVSGGTASPSSPPPMPQDGASTQDASYLTIHHSNNHNNILNNKEPQEGQLAQRSAAEVHVHAVPPPAAMQEPGK